MVMKGVYPSGRLYDYCIVYSAVVLWCVLMFCTNAVVKAASHVAC